MNIKATDKRIPRRRVAATSQGVETRAVLLYAATFLLGLAAILVGGIGGREVGALAVVVGGGGLAFWGRRRWLEWREEQAAQEAAARRTSLRAIRRERNTQERARRDRQREAQKHAVTLQAERHAQEQRLKHLTLQAEAERRSAQEAALASEVARLRALTDAQLLAEVETAFTKRGLHPQPADTPERDADCDLHLRTEDHALEVARCLPMARRAGGVDVQAIEAWRQAEGARHAYLVALAGFSLSAIRQAQGLPITLVEPHLLAHWQQLPGRMIRPVA